MAEQSPSLQVVSIPPEGGAIQTAVMFVDLVSSSEFSSILSLKEYSDYVEMFETVCATQVKYFFEQYHGDYIAGKHYQMSLIGDELVVFMYTPSPTANVYQLICLAVMLKCAWLASPVNSERLLEGAPSVELAIGIHAGQVWAVPQPGGYQLRGFAINVAKRVETASREGEHFRIMISGAAFKQVNRKMRLLLIGTKKLIPMKGIVLPVAVHELLDSFVGVSGRLAPQFAEGFRNIAKEAIASNSFDNWVHSCYQVLEGERAQAVTDECIEQCRDVLSIQPNNAIALYYLAEGLKDRGELEAAILLFTDLVKCWPTLTDGWLELARAAKTTGNLILAAMAVRQARRHGAGLNEEELPEIPKGLH